MKHIVRVERHLIRDILASMIGGSLTVAVVQKSWMAAIIAIAAGLALFVTERADIQEEEE